VANVYTLKLKDQDGQHWDNSILVRLGVATGQINKGFGDAVFDPDEILQRAETMIWGYRELRDK